MKEVSVGWRNSVIHAVYSSVLKPWFFRYDAEDVHDRMSAFGARLGRYPFMKGVTRGLFGYADSRLEQTILGLKFSNPIGLAAGFDKNAELIDILPSVGFGFEEVGSITASPCAGNPKPRLWRLQKSQGLVVYYGLKNDGSETIAGRLAGRKFDFVVGTSIAMTNCKDNLDLATAVKDYEKGFKAFVEIGDYFTVNISCPNAEGGQTFTVPAKLDMLLDSLDKIETKKPIFLKLTPDLSLDEVDALLDVARGHRVHGLITVNLTKKRDNPKIIDADVPEKGGISGKPVQALSDDLLSHIYKREGKRFVLVGVGGVFSAEDAYAKIRHGASLIQLITGMIFEGPQVVSEINRGLVRLLDRDGFKDVSEAVGVDA